MSQGCAKLSIRALSWSEINENVRPAIVFHADLDALTATPKLQHMGYLLFIEIIEIVLASSSLYIDFYL